MVKLLSTLLLLCAIVVPVHAATIYKWTDQEGQIHYTRTPPPKSMTDKKVESKDADKVSTTKIEESPVVQQPAKQTPVTLEEAAEAKRRQEMCQSAQQQLHEMSRTDKVREHGHEIEITEDERLRRLEEYEELVKEYCTARMLPPTQQPVQHSNPRPVPQKIKTTAPEPVQQPVPQEVKKPALQPIQKLEKSPKQMINNPQTQSNQ